MATNSRKTENQHYVPQFLLRNFTVLGKPNQIIVFDKQSGRTFPTNIKNVAAEKGFYDFVLKDYEMTLEPSLSNLEGQAAAVLDKVIANEAVTCITDEERITLAFFIAVQFVRVKGHRARWDDIGEKLMKRLEPEASDELKQEMRRAQDLSHVSYMKTITDCHEYVPYLLGKIWTLQKTTTAQPFVISDCPVTLHNTVNHRPYGNIGFAVRGIEIYLPLSKTLTLGLWCPSLGERMDADTLRQIEEGAPLVCSNDNVVYLNHLQIRYAERHVMSSKDDFDLARQMISDNAHIKSGPRLEMA